MVLATQSAGAGRTSRPIHKEAILTDASADTLGQGSMTDEEPDPHVEERRDLLGAGGSWVDQRIPVVRHEGDAGLSWPGRPTLADCVWLCLGIVPTPPSSSTRIPTPTSASPERSRPTTPRWLSSTTS